MQTPEFNLRQNLAAEINKFCVLAPCESRLASAIAELVDENQLLRDRLAVSLMDGTPEEKAAAAREIAGLRLRVRSLEAQAERRRAERDEAQGIAYRLRRMALHTTKAVQKLRRAA